jgi:hypothetical protein
MSRSNPVASRRGRVPRSARPAERILTSPRGRRLDVALHPVPARDGVDDGVFRPERPPQRRERLVEQCLAGLDVPVGLPGRPAGRTSQAASIIARSSTVMVARSASSLCAFAAK